MATTEALIFAALAGRVHTLDVGLPVAWPNVNFTAPVDAKGKSSPYLSVAFIPNGAFRLGIPSDMPHRHIGLLQVTVWWSRNDGEAAPREIAGRVAEHFPADLRLSSGGVSVRITKDPDVAGMLVDQTGVQIPVTVSWECFA